MDSDPVTSLPYPLDRMRLTMWRMAEGDTYRVHITGKGGALAAVQDTRKLWDWSWWLADSRRRVA